MSERVALAPAALVLLAAGYGSRFTGPGHKLAQPLGRSGRSVLDTSVANAVATGLPVVLVTTARFAESATAKRADILVTLGDDGEAGIGRSISAGVRATPEANGWLIMPADMPLIRPSSIIRVAEALRRSHTVRALYEGRPGHPVGFAKGHYSHLIQLCEDIGARSLLVAFPPAHIETHDPGTTLDIDTVGDLERLSAVALSVADITE